MRSRPKGRRKPDDCMQAKREKSLKTLFFNAFASRRRPLVDQIIQPVVSPYEAERLRELLVKKTPAELADHELQAVVESNLWMLTPEAFLYFLPAFLYASLDSYPSVSVFASELIGALTQPSRTDVEEALDQLNQASSELGLSPEMIGLLRKQQLEWADSGAPAATFHQRFDNLSQAEGKAILAFLTAFQEAHGEDFPFNELEIAIDRFWGRYRDL